MGVGHAVAPLAEWGGSVSMYSMKRSCEASSRFLSVPPGAVDFMQVFPDRQCMRYIVHTSWVSVSLGNMVLSNGSGYQKL